MNDLIFSDKERLELDFLSFVSSMCDCKNLKNTQFVKNNKSP